jgi:hypothetical protein
VALLCAEATPVTSIAAQNALRTVRFNMVSFASIKPLVEFTLGITW